MPDSGSTKARNFPVSWITINWSRSACIMNLIFMELLLLRHSWLIYRLIHYTNDDNDDYYDYNYNNNTLISAQDGSGWSASRNGPFNPSERVNGTHWKWGWMGRRSGLDAIVMRNPIVGSIVNHYTDSYRKTINQNTWLYDKGDYKWCERFLPVNLFNRSHQL